MSRTNDEGLDVLRRLVTSAKQATVHEGTVRCSLSLPQAEQILADVSAICGERDRQYEENVGQIARYAELERALHELQQSILDAIVVGRNYVDDALHRYGYDSMHFADVRRVWHLLSGLKPFKVQFTKDWCMEAAAREEGHEVGAGRRAPCDLDPPCEHTSGLSNCSTCVEPQ